MPSQAGMITDNEFARMREKLTEAVRELCSICVEPRPSALTLNFNDPLQCTCSCHKSEGLIDAMRGIDAGLNR